MNDKINSNQFKFSLYQEDTLLGERMFDADQFNPFTRYSIDIRDILPRAMSRLQRTLSKKSYTTRVDENLDLYNYNHALINSYPRKYREDMLYNPKSITYKIEDKTIKGVECKIVLYINDKTIVERMFYVDGFNPVARWSLDIIDVINEITETIEEKIIKTDIVNTWDDYDLINLGGMNITQIRELPLFKRREILSRINRKR